MDVIIDVLRERIKKYKSDNKLNTSTLRKHKIHGIGHDTIWKLMTNDEFNPSFSTIRKLLTGFEIPFEENHSIKLL